MNVPGAPFGAPPAPPRRTTSRGLLIAGLLFGGFVVVALLAGICAGGVMIAGTRMPNAPVQPTKHKPPARPPARR